MTLGFCILEQTDYFNEKQLVFNWLKSNDSVNYYSLSTRNNPTQTKRMHTKCAYACTGVYGRESVCECVCECVCGCVSVCECVWVCASVCDALSKKEWSNGAVRVYAATVKGLPRNRIRDTMAWESERERGREREIKTTRESGWERRTMWTINLLKWTFSFLSLGQ